MRLDEYLQALESEGREHGDRELMSLFDGRPDTTTAARMWTAIADGSASVDETLVWAQLVAEKVMPVELRPHAPCLWSLDPAGRLSPSAADARECS